MSNLTMDWTILTKHRTTIHAVDIIDIKNNEIFLPHAKNSEVRINKFINSKFKFVSM